MNKSTSINIDEAKKVIKHIITNNSSLQSEGLPPVSLEMVGHSGIGKTSTLLQVAKEVGLPLVKINLAQIEELGDLVGSPIRQFEMKDERGDLRWVDEHATDACVSNGYDFTGKNRMSYCPPEWIAGKGEGGILLLDDWNRADPRFTQAVMELIDRQQYISWVLPKGWNILLSANPSDGEYMVTEIDTAQKTRFMSFTMKFDIKCWAKWAEESGIDGRCINFLLLHPELITDKINPRSVTTFFNAIRSIQPFDSNLPLIQILGEGSVGIEFATTFTIFINNRLDKIIPPFDIFFDEDEKKVIGRLKTHIGEGKDYRADIASTIVHRMINFIHTYAKSNQISDNVINRIAAILTSECLAVDLRFNLVKQIYMGDTSKFKKLMLNKDIIKYIKN